ncbi:galactokinase family protein [Paraglaciecola aquimarina]|uniref:Galactokinase family protein n=1 Tax=Paraglaciecola aquimarina TaxID=1235557 RepID=A0ABU3SVR2_9ALTE|nr:galactokinase family protein [Paraglaciecola aquimarina]MDU0354012.1 galactokinase family protein [Paraglaciecola aquimarina]
MSDESLVNQLFKDKFGYTASTFCHAPDRVNLIGDHTDYNDGFVFPAAINFGTNIAASRRDDLTVHIYAHDCDAQSTHFVLHQFSFDADKMWSNYVQGTLQALMTIFPDIKGADLVVSGNVPQGAGLSSSASFEIAVLKTFAELYDLDLAGVTAAKLGQMAENNFVGCNCGIMDQLISAMGLKGQAYVVRLPRLEL